jgi:hypothetical protein
MSMPRFRASLRPRKLKPGATSDSAVTQRVSYAMATSTAHFFAVASTGSASVRSGSLARTTWSTFTRTRSPFRFGSSARPARIFWVMVRGGSPARARIGVAWKVAARPKQGQGRRHGAPPRRRSPGFIAAASHGATRRSFNRDGSRRRPVGQYELFRLFRARSSCRALKIHLPRGFGLTCGHVQRGVAERRRRY